MEKGKIDMKRQIDADKLWDNRPQIPEGKEGDWVAGFEYCLYAFSQQLRKRIDTDADEIFAAVKKAIKEEALDYCNSFEKMETSEMREYFKIKQDTAIFLYMKIDHLEKKYTEEKRDG